METIYWKQKDGKLISVDDMDLNHLRNTLKMIIKANQRARAMVKSEPRVVLHGEMAQEHADAYAIYKATGRDILSDCPVCMGECECGI